MIVVKVISNLLFAKETATKVINGKLQMLYAGIHDEIRATNARIMLAELKTTPVSFKPKCLLIRR